MAEDADDIMEEDGLVQRLFEAIVFPLPRDLNETLAVIKGVLEDALVGDNAAFRGLLREKSTNAALSCGQAIAKNELIFSCRDCAADSTCVLCAKCFQRQDHKDHNYIYSLSRGLRCYCNCGEEGSWKTPLSCPDHKSDFSRASDNLTGEQRAFIVRVDEFMKILLSRMTSMLQGVAYRWDLMSDKDYEGQAALVLTSSHYLSLSEMGSLISETLKSDASYSELIASNIENQGFAVAEFFPLPGSRAWAKNCLERLRIGGFEARVETVVAVKYRYILNGIVTYLLELASSLPYLRHTILSNLVAKLPKSDFYSFQNDDFSFTGVVFALSNELWKWFRAEYQNLLAFGLAFQDIRIALMHCFGKYTKVIIHGMPGSREPNFSILNFATQLLTVPSIALLAYKEGILSKLQGHLRDLFVDEFSSSELVTAADERTRLRDGFFEAVRYLTEMIGCITASLPVDESNLAQDRLYWDRAAKILLPLQERMMYTRQEENHVEYEDGEWEDEVDLALHMSRFIISNVSSCIKQESALIDCLAWTGHVFVKFLRERSEYSRPNQLSFQQPALWLIGSLLQQYSYVTGPRVKALASKSIIPNSAAMMLNRLTEVKVGLWKFNGDAVVEQARIAYRTRTRTQYMVILWHAFACCNVRSEEIGRLLRTALDDTGSDFSVATIRTVIMSIFCGSTISLNLKGSIRCAIIHALAEGPIAYSELRRRIFLSLPYDESFDETLNAVSEIIESRDVPGARKYSLNKSAIQEYNHYYWEYDDDMREKSLEYMQSHHNYNPLLVALSREYTDAKHMKHFFDASDLGFMLVRGFIRSVLLQKEWDRLFDDLLVLMNVHVQSGSNLKFNLDQHEKERLYTLVDKLDKTARPLASNLLARTVCDYIPRDASLEKELTEQDKALHEARRRKVLESMKTAQTNFQNMNTEANITVDSTTEIQQSPKMLESGTCVFCHEPAGECTDDYGIPFAFGWVGLSVWPAELNTATTAIVLSSCFHLLHVKCYDRLRPGPWTVKECPLCQALIMDLKLVVPAPSPISYKGDFLTLLPSIGLQECKSRLDDVVSRIKAAEPQISQTQFSSILDDLSRCCRQLPVLGDAPESANILRMSRYFRAVLDGHMEHVWQHHDLHVSHLLPYLGDNTQTKGPTFNILQSFIAVIAQLYPISAIDEEAVRMIICIFKTYVLLAAHLFSKYLLPTSKDPDQLIVAVAETGCSQMLTFIKIWLQGDFDIPPEAILSSIFGKELIGLSSSNDLSQWLLKGAEFMNFNAENLPQKIALFPIRPIKFADLPETLLDLLLDNIEKIKICEHCGEKIPSICLTCGDLVCANQSCIANCSGANMMLLELYSGSVSLHHITDIDTYHFVMKQCPTPYVTEHGELGSDSKSWGRMLLCQSRYDYLKRLYLSGRFKPSESDD